MCIAISWSSQRKGEASMGALETSLGSASAKVAELFPANVRGPESSRPDSRARKLHSAGVKFAPLVLRGDWALIRQAVAGNPEAQERLFKTHTPRLYRTAFAILRNKEDAEDAVQESWCKAYAKPLIPSRGGQPFPLG